jgi:predicted NBD/HSP70 family sugar kinase
MSVTPGEARGAHASRLRATAKAIPEHQRANNRALVLQHLFHAGPASRADLARTTSLTRVTVSDLINGLLAEGLVEELGTVPGRGGGKPAILVGMRPGAYQIVAIDLSASADNVMHGAVLTLDGADVVRRRFDTGNRTGDELVSLIETCVRDLAAEATAPILGVGVGAPGIITEAGVVLEAPNRKWSDLPLAHILTQTLGLPVHVANDADVAALGEFTYGGGANCLLVVTIGQGVGAGLIVDGSRVHGAGSAVGEIGHLTVVPDGNLCACGRTGCLETVLSAPALRRDTSPGAAERAGEILGIALAPIVSALNLGEIRLSGPADLLEPTVRNTVWNTIVERTMPAVSAGLTVRMAALGDDVVLRGAAVLVLGAQLGVS